MATTTAHQKESRRLSVLVLPPVCSTTAVQPILSLRVIPFQHGGWPRHIPTTPSHQPIDTGFPLSLAQCRSFPLFPFRSRVRVSPFFLVALIPPLPLATLRSPAFSPLPAARSGGALSRTHSIRAILQFVPAIVASLASSRCACVPCPTWPGPLFPPCMQWRRLRALRALRGWSAGWAACRT